MTAVPSGSTRDTGLSINQETSTEHRELPALTTVSMGTETLSASQLSRESRAKKPAQAPKNPLAPGSSGYSPGTQSSCAATGRESSLRPPRQTVGSGLAALRSPTSGAAGSSSGSATASTEASPAAAAVQRARRLRPPPGRVDMVATFSLSVFVVILFIIIFPYMVALGVTNGRSECVLAAHQRVLVSVVVVSSMGVAAVCGPLALVLFSADFRRALRDLCGRVARALTGRRA